MHAYTHIYIYMGCKPLEIPGSRASMATVRFQTGPLEPAELERSISDAGGWRCYDGAHEPGQGMLLAFLGFYE